MPSWDVYVVGRNVGAAAAALHAALPLLVPAELQGLGQRLLLWGLFGRLLATVYIISFLSIASQVCPLCGSRGVTPLRPQLDAIRRDFGLARGVLHFPTLFWLDCSDAALLALPLLGAALAAAHALGGPVSWGCLLGAQLCLLSLDLPLDLHYPWDCLLYEAGWLALALPALPAGQVAAAALPAPGLAWAFRWLLFRVMLGFGPPAGGGCGARGVYRSVLRPSGSQSSSSRNAAIQSFVLGYQAAQATIG
jgi:hypothetical protein